MTELFLKLTQKEMVSLNVLLDEVSIRESQDPFQELPHGQAGRINIIDLANRDSCAFIATEDIGKVNSIKNLRSWGD